MTIQEYKDKLVSIVEDMEREHGCDISIVRITANSEMQMFYNSKVYDVEIEM